MSKHTFDEINKEKFKLFAMPAELYSDPDGYYDKMAGKLLMATMDEFKLDIHLASFLVVIIEEFISNSDDSDFSSIHDLHSRIFDSANKSLFGREDIKFPIKLDISLITYCIIIRDQKRFPKTKLLEMINAVDSILALNIITEMVKIAIEKEKAE